MIKFTILLVRKPSLTHAEIVAHHKDVHADFFISGPVVRDPVRRYLQQHSMPVELPGMPPVRFDGITNSNLVRRCGRTRAVLLRSEYMARIRPDEAYFLDLAACEFVVTTEHAMNA